MLESLKNKAKMLPWFQSTKETFSECWKELPALYYSLSFLIGCFALFVKNFLPFLLLLLLWIPYLSSLFQKKKETKRILFSLLFALFSYFYTQFLYPDFGKLDKPITGEGVFSISSVGLSPSSFREGFVFRGTFLTFTDKKSTLHNIPCLVYLSTSSVRPLANKDYFLRGTLLPKSDFLFLFKLGKKELWRPCENSWNIEEIRFCAKNLFREYLKKYIHDKRVAGFLAGLIIGELDENFLKFSFGRTGLQHVMAVSGFNFTLLALFFAFFLRPFFPFKITAFILLVLINGYFLFLGNSPSIQRAWMTIQLALFGALFTKQYLPLNALGASLLFGLVLNPWNLTNMGFQLSFLSTASLLISYPFFKEKLSFLFKKRSLKEAKALTLFSQHGHLVVSFLKEALSLSFAVNIAIIPVLLFYFHWFPLLSLIYNLFFPFLVSASILLIFLALLSHLLIPPLAIFIHTINNLFTQKLLELITYPPAPLEFFLRFSHFSFWALILYLSLLFFVTLFFHFRLRKCSLPEAFSFC